MLAIVLNDGTTWTNAEGCCFVELPDDYDGDEPLGAGIVRAVLPDESNLDRDHYGQYVIYVENAEMDNYEEN